MASSHCTRRLLCKSTASSLKSAIRQRNHSPLLNSSATVSSQHVSNSSCTSRRFPSFIRTSAYKLGCLQSLMPLHSAVATSRMISNLSLDSGSCRALSQGTLCCNSLGP
ncbi:hypothetical protein L6164_000705 [Bauhinia variegata]|uniref:Uncharacterized protein n=1 Tax=Bauhinia variegata TaxID=167791 RepID=A0ACB9QD87_BAUVA|nr:hypothetical protein L6164_000705 [Bauhinia variegata]